MNRTKNSPNKQDKSDKQATIIRSPKNKDNPYTMTLRETAQDSDLSWEARGILWYLLSKPDTWEVRVEDLERTGCKTIRVRRILRELIKAGYMQPRTRYQKNGKWIYTSYACADEPLWADDYANTPLDDVPLCIFETVQKETFEKCTIKDNRESSNYENKDSLGSENPEPRCAPDSKLKQVQSKVKDTQTSQTVEPKPILRGESGIYSETNAYFPEDKSVSDPNPTRPIDVSELDPEEVPPAPGWERVCQPHKLVCVGDECDGHDVPAEWRYLENMTCYCGACYKELTQEVTFVSAETSRARDNGTPPPTMPGWYALPREESTASQACHVCESMATFEQIQGGRLLCDDCYAAEHMRGKPAQTHTANETLTEDKPPGWFDYDDLIKAIGEVFKEYNGGARNYAAMLRGTAKKGEWKEHRFPKGEEVDATELRKWAGWFKENKDYSMVKVLHKVHSEIMDWRKQGSPEAGQKQAGKSRYYTAENQAPPTDEQAAKNLRLMQEARNDSN